MNIIIAGAGEVGFHLAKMLCSEAQNIFIIDDDEDRLSYVQSKLDIYTVWGNGKDVASLKEAKVKSCDLLIAATSSEETNLLACIVGKKLGAKKTIARVSSYQEIKQDIVQYYLELGVDQIISPVMLAAEEIVRLVNQSAFTDDFEFEEGELSVFGIAIQENAALVGYTVLESAALNTKLNYKPLALLRNQNTFIVNNDTTFQIGDIVYFISKESGLEEITKLAGKESKKIENVMIMGGSNIGIYTAQKLQKKYNVTLIERDKKTAEKIAELLDKTLVINTDGSDVASLESQSIEDMDAFICVTGDSETNIISSLVAKSHGVHKTIARVENMDYIGISQNIGVDSLINKKVLAAGEIFKYIRQGDVEAILSLHGTNAEIIEFKVKPKSKIASKILGKLRLPEYTRIAGVIRDGEGIIPFDNFQVQEGDKVIVLCLPQSIYRMEKLFK